MYFFIDADLGDQIHGWVAPDHPSRTPQVSVHYGEGPPAIVEATVVRPDLVPTLHGTGLCGFVVTEEHVPDLAARSDLAIFHKEDGMLVYRRPPPTALPDRKLFRLETQLAWHGGLNAMLEPLFQLPYFRLELLGEETLRWIPQLPFSRSIYATGRVRVRPLDGYLRDNGFFFTALLRDPWHELAEQLLLMRMAARRPDLGSRFHLAPGHRSLVDRMTKAPWTTVSELDKLLGSLDPRERSALSDPVTHLLGADGLSGRGGPDILANALRALSDFHAVGLRSDLDGFLDTLAAVLETDDLPRVEQPEHDTVRELAAALERLPSAKKLIRLDLELYARVHEAYHADSLEHR